MNYQAMQASLWPVEDQEVRSMGGFGERMQREREMRSISLEEIAESTKIGCRMLRALEEEDFGKLPGGIFNKGFVRAYAKFLGIDEEQAVTDFQAAFLEKQQKQSSNGSNGLQHGDVLAQVSASADQTDSSSQPDQAAGFMRAAVIIVCLIGIGGLGWKFLGNKLSSAPKPATVQNEISQPAATVPQVLQPQPTSPPVTSAARPSVQAPEVEAPAATKTETAVTAGQETATADDAASAVTSVFRLQVHARERSWIKVTGDDGKLLMQGEIAPSATRSFRAVKQMVLTVGNAPGVEISYNGKALPQFPPDPKTRTLTFTPEGLQQ
jgi:cytoskeleton protein RodZ